jgi:hypothetical protein
MFAELVKPAALFPGLGEDLAQRAPQNPSARRRPAAPAPASHSGRILGEPIPLVGVRGFVARRTYDLRRPSSVRGSGPGSPTPEFDAIRVMLRPK